MYKYTSSPTLGYIRSIYTEGRKESEQHERNLSCSAELPSPSLHCGIASEKNKRVYRYIPTHVREKERDRERERKRRKGRSFGKFANGRAPHGDIWSP